MKWLFPIVFVGVASFVSLAACSKPEPVSVPTGETKQGTSSSSGANSKSGDLKPSDPNGNLNGNTK